MKDVDIIKTNTFVIPYFLHVYSNSRYDPLPLSFHHAKNKVSFNIYRHTCMVDKEMEHVLTSRFISSQNSFAWGHDGIGNFSEFILLFSSEVLGESRHVCYFQVWCPTLKYEEKKNNHIHPEQIKSIWLDPYLRVLLAWWPFFRRDQISYGYR